jgi:hypothetical protein
LQRKKKHLHNHVLPFGAVFTFSLTKDLFFVFFNFEKIKEYYFSTKKENYLFVRAKVKTASKTMHINFVTNFYEGLETNHSV